MPMFYPELALMLIFRINNGHPQNTRYIPQKGIQRKLCNIDAKGPLNKSTMLSI